MNELLSQVQEGMQENAVWTIIIIVSYILIAAGIVFVWLIEYKEANKINRAAMVVVTVAFIVALLLYGLQCSGIISLN